MIVPIVCSNANKPHNFACMEGKLNVTELLPVSFLLAIVYFVYAKKENIEKMFFNSNPNNLCTLLWSLLQLICK